jgi:hypothetical protein
MRHRLPCRTRLVSSLVKHGLGGIDFGPIDRNKFGADAVAEVTLETVYALLEFRDEVIHQ